MSKESASHIETTAGGAGAGEPQATRRIIKYFKPNEADGQASVKKAGWYETDTVDGEAIVNENTRLLNKAELKDLDLDHKIGPEAHLADETQNAEADVKSAAKTLHDESKPEQHPVCAASARKGERKFATHLVTMLDGTQEYRHIDEIGAKFTYSSAIRLPE